jgi:NADH-quinone oxidoreductase subunit J
VNVDAINWNSVFFLLFGLIACGFAVAVVVSTNIVRMAVSLVISLGAVAGLFFLAGAEFVGAMQLMVYVGGTMVLLVFGVMLTARGPLAEMKITAGQWLLALAVGGSLLAVLWQTAFSVEAWTSHGAAQRPPQGEASPSAAPIGMALLGVRVDQPPAAEGAPQRTPSGYLLAFEIISVHLVVVLIGAAYLARTRRRAAGDSPGSLAGEPVPDDSGGC